MYKDRNSISTFHPVTPYHESSTPSLRFSPKAIPSSTPTSEDNFDKISKMTDADSRILSLKYKFTKFQDGIKDIQQQAKKESQKM
jgi:hypothetical protein